MDGYENNFKQSDSPDRSARDLVESLREALVAAVKALKEIETILSQQAEITALRAELAAIKSVEKPVAIEDYAEIRRRARMLANRAAVAAGWQGMAALECPICGRKKGSLNLEAHIRRQHSDEIRHMPAARFAMEMVPGDPTKHEVIA